MCMGACVRLCVHVCTCTRGSSKTTLGSWFSLTRGPWKLNSDVRLDSQHGFPLSHLPSSCSYFSVLSIFNSARSVELSPFALWATSHHLSPQRSHLPLLGPELGLSPFTAAASLTGHLHSSCVDFPDQPDCSGCCESLYEF